MTTIAASFEDRLLVTDSRISDGDTTWRAIKAEVFNGRIYATAGEAADTEKFMAWIRRGRRGARPKVDSEFQALALTPEGLFFFDQHLYPMRLLHPMAIGSGAKAARGAMAMGADIRRAVEIACDIDHSSGLPLQEYRLEEEKKNGT
jgi:hypothetical protein